MKRILCYGDSNTWGYIPENGKRYDNSTRWTKVLQTLLGNDYEVIEEGLKARTTNIDDIKEPKGNRNGAVFFPQCVYSHDPLDYIIIFLGTNDMKSKFNSNAKTCANNIEEKYIKVLKDKIFQDLIQIPQIIIVAPSIIKEGLFDGFEGAENKSKTFNTEYEKMALKNNCLFVNNLGLIPGSDGVHLTKQSHKLLAEKIYSIIKS